VGIVSPGTESSVRDIVAQRYVSVLGDYLSGAGEAALAQAYELGRQASRHGIGVVEMAMVHHEALVQLLSATPERPALVVEAARFFAESLAAFEVSLRADVALRQAKVEAENANSELESFSYSVAHDLRAPLRSIDGFSQALLEDCAEQLDDRGREYLKYIRESAQRMAQLIDDLLALSRVTRTEMYRVRVDMSMLVRSVAEGLQAADEHRAVTWTIQDGLWATGDARLLRAALENLLGNAWKFTGKQPEARIEFGALVDKRPIVYFVRDNGAGFDMTYGDKLFGVFQRLHSADEFEGTGIGLATVQRIVRRHSGRVWAEGETGRGASFYFTLEDETATS
jgi:light-regulated signal transduction histidine kinase (bacteriophytochrome)